MRRLLTGLLAVVLHAAIVDQIAISVGTKVITDSQIDLRIRLTALENKTQPNFSLASRKQTAKLLIDQKLIEREMDVGHYPRTSPDDAKRLVEGYGAENFPDSSSLNAILTDSGLTVEDLGDYLTYRNDLLTFLDVRFRPAVDVAEQNPAIAQKKADQELETWLADQRKRARIVYLEKGLE
jgi:hypothetical protein